MTYCKCKEPDEHVSSWHKFKGTFLLFKAERVTCRSCGGFVKWIDKKERR